MSDDPFDLGKLVLPPEMVCEHSISVPRKIRYGHFVKVPCWWIERLAKSTRYRVTFLVALHLLYRHWKLRGQPIKLANGALKMEGVSRGTKWRALGELERAGLITIERRLRKSPVIAVHVVRP
jgi:hypothetical protein